MSVSSNENPENQSQSGKAKGPPSECTGAAAEDPVEEPPSERQDAASDDATERHAAAEIAARLLSAQIIARSHYETSVALAEDFQAVAAALVREFLPRSSTSTPTSGPNKLADTLESLGSARNRIPVPDFQLPPSLGSSAIMVEVARRQAEELLRPTIPPSSVVFAEQLFDPHEELTRNGISTRFQTWEWTGLTGSGSKETLFDEIETWFAGHLSGGGPELRGHYQDPEPEERITNTLLSALNTYKDTLRGSDRQRWRSIQRIVDAIESHLHNPSWQPPTVMPTFLSRNDAVGFIKFLFVDHSLEDGNRPKKYRPWGLFRYLRLFGDTPHRDDEVENLLRKLSTSASLSAEPKPLLPYYCGFSPIWEDGAPVGRQES